MKRVSNCRAYQRRDATSSARLITLSGRHWTMIQAKQDELAEVLNVRRVSRPLALRHILDDARKAGIC